MLTVILGLAAALAYGSADFVGGLSGRRLPVPVVTALSATTGLIVLLVIGVPILGGTWSTGAVLWGGLSAITSATALPLLYAALARGPMSIISPLTALLGAMVPMVWGLLQGDRLGPMGPVALVVALIAVVLVGFVPPGRDPADPTKRLPIVRPTVPALLLALVAGVLIGVIVVLLDQTPHDSGILPLLVNRIGMVVILGVASAILLTRMRARARAANAAGAASVEGVRVFSGFTPRTIAFASAAGLLDTTANTLILSGLRIGDVSVVGVLTAMYPAGTILLASVLLRERIAPVQWIGLVLALGAAALLALA
ncbi:EamA family transporter [Schumannella soli]|uniref:EamA family transporter n=1 Tax=Schumannella soli TaxID=2590779 RepID=A0A506Y929_9MICO|nr:EamA family transporter [Schumannella soli]TPW77578.1 EamA family transporter [Schumannella soli]